MLLAVECQVLVPNLRALPAWRVVENHAFPDETTSRAIAP